MATLNISLPDTLNFYIFQRIEYGDYSNASDYIRTLIRKEKEDSKLIISNELLEAIERISLLSIDKEQKKQMIYAYTLIEQKRKNPISDENFIKNIDSLSDEAIKNGLTPEILKSVLL